MKGTKHPKIKICCIKDKEEAQLAIHSGANVIGLVSKMPSGPGQIKIKTIKEISESVNDEIETFLLSSETESSQIIKQYNQVKTSAIQLVDKLDINEYHLIRKQLPFVKLIQVIHVMDQQSIIDAKELSKFVDYILLDSGNPNLVIKEFGGTGRVHDWSISKRIREEVEIPIYLAGGLNSTNIVEAINVVEPYGVDLCSGVRTNDVLDESKLKLFMSKLI